MSTDTHVLKHAGGEFMKTAPWLAGDAAADAAFGAQLTDGCYYFDNTSHRFKYRVKGAWHFKPYNPLGVRYVPIAGASHPGDVWTALDFQAFVRENSAAVGYPGSYAPSAATFTAPRPGDYYVQGHVRLEDIEDDAQYLQVRILKNGVVFSAGQGERREIDVTLPVPLTSPISAFHNTTLFLDVGETVTIEARLFKTNNISKNYLVSNDGSNFVTIQEI